VADTVGVQGESVRAIAASGLQCVVSDFQKEDGAQKTLREAALEFHRILQNGLRKSAIIPFSFPTILEDEAAVAEHVREQAQEYKTVLSRLRGTVQMEISFTSGETAPIAGGGTGTEYLRTRQALYSRLRKASEAVRTAANGLLRGWRERDSPGGLRGFYLIGDGKIDAFGDKVRAADLPEGVQLRVSGPWPATEFVKQEDGR
jgi:hypothetical protein